jgi:hypothetical protein
MTWNPDSFTPAQRQAAAKAIVRAQVIVDRLDRNEFGPGCAEILARAYNRVDDMLAMLYDDLYGLDGGNPQWPSAS